MAESAFKALVVSIERFGCFGLCLCSVLKHAPLGAPRYFDQEICTCVC